MTDLLNIQPLTSAQYDWSIQTIIDQVSKGNLYPAPDLVFETPWDEVQMSRFVESVILGIPTGQICGIVSVKAPNGPLSIIDGVRRVAALCLFAGDKVPWNEQITPGFRLAGTQYDHGLEGMSFEELRADDDVLSLFQNGTMTVKRIIHQPWLDLSTLRERMQGISYAGEPHPSV